MIAMKFSGTPDTPNSQPHQTAELAELAETSHLVAVWSQSRADLTAAHGRDTFSMMLDDPLMADEGREPIDDALIVPGWMLAAVTSAPEQDARGRDPLPEEN